MPDRYIETKSVLPSSYVEFIEATNGWEGDLGKDPSFEHIVIWDKQTIQARWDDYEMKEIDGLQCREDKNANSLRPQRPLRFYLFFP